MKRERLERAAAVTVWTYCVVAGIAGLFLLSSVFLGPPLARAAGCISGLVATIGARLGLQIPQTQQCEWDVPLQFDLNRIDQFACFPGIACGVHLGPDTIGPLPLSQGGLGGDISGIAKGGLFAGTGAGAVGILPAGANDLPLVYDLTQTTGLRAGGTVTANPLIVNGGVNNDGSGLKHARVFLGTVPAATTITQQILWGSSFTNFSYTANCSVVDSDSVTTNGLRVHHIQQTTIDGIIVVVVNDDAGAGHAGLLECLAVRDS